MNCGLKTGPVSQAEGEASAVALLWEQARQVQGHQEGQCGMSDSESGARTQKMGPFHHSEEEAVMCVFAGGAAK